LEISKVSSNHGIKLTRTGTSSGSASLQVQSGGKLALTSGSDFAINTPSATDALVVKATTGNVGIGTTSPGNKLTLPNAQYISWKDPAGTGENCWLGQDSSGDFNINIGQSGGSLLLKTANTERLRIDSSGNVGIGTSSPSSYNSNGQSLVVAGTGNTGITVSSGTASKSSIMFADGTGGTAAYRGSLKYDHSSDDMILSTATAERMRIDSSGRVLVGISGASGFGQLETTTLATEGQCILARTGGNVGIGTTSPSFPLHVAGKIKANDRVITPIIASPDDTSVIHITNSANVGIGTSSPAEKLDVNGTSKFKGITETQTTSSGTTYTVDLSLGTIFNLTSASTCTVTMPSATAGKSFTVIAAVPSAWSGTIKWSGGSAPTGTGICIYTFVSNGTDWYGMEAGNAFA